MIRPAAATAVLLAAGCAAATIYPDPAGPRYGGAVTPRAAPPAADSIRIVTFNIAYARQTQRAIPLLRTQPGLAGADLVFLQEMDAPSAQAVAESLGLNWVYYPASLHPVSHRDFGNAVLSRWPIAEDRKLILPHLARGRHTQRIAVAATIMAPGGPLRVYGVHLATMVGNGPSERRQQLSIVLADADSFPAVLIAGDFNSETVPEIALERGYTWPSRGLPHTSSVWTLDHVLLRGLALASDSSIGVGRDEGTSDHKPVWAVLVRTPAAR